MTIEYMYLDGTTWLPYPPGGIVNQTGSFIVRATKVVGDKTYVKTKTVFICGDKYAPTVGFDIVDNATERTYLQKINGIPSEDIASIAWTVTENGTPVTAPTTPKTVALNTVVCASAVVTLNCGCDPINVEQVCYTFNNEYGCTGEMTLTVETVDGCYRPVRQSTMDPSICISIDLVMWKYQPGDPWNILGEKETICGDTVYFKRVVTFCGDACPSQKFEISVP